MIELAKAAAPYVMLLTVLGARWLGAPADLCTAIAGGMLMQMQPLGRPAAVAGASA